MSSRHQKPDLTNSRGFGLLETIIVAGLLSVAILGTTEMVRQLKIESHTITAKKNLALLQRSLASTIADNKSWRQTYLLNSASSGAIGGGRSSCTSIYDRGCWTANTDINNLTSGTNTTGMGSSASGELTLPDGTVVSADGTITRRDSSQSLNDANRNQPGTGGGANSAGPGTGGRYGGSMDCLRNATACTANTPRPFALIDGAGNLVFDATNNTEGFDLEGRRCTSFGASASNCIFRYNLRWSAICPGASCTSPLIAVTAQLQVASNAGLRPIDYSKYSVTKVLRPAQ